MKRTELAFWIQLLIVVTLLIGTFLGFVAAPWMGRTGVLEYPEYAHFFWPCLIFIWVTGLPFYKALWDSWFISQNMACDRSICEDNARRLRRISLLSLLESLLYFTGAIVLAACNVLHPSILLLILFIIFIGIAIALVAAALSHMVEKACAIKQENDLTV